MKLIKIKIENFRGIQSLEIDDFKDINLFIGKNNTGKTSILEAIFLSIGVSNPMLVNQIDTFRGLVHVEGDDFQFVFYGLNPEKHINLSTEFINKSQFRSLSIIPVYQHSNDQDLKKESSKSILSASSTIDKKTIMGLDFSFTVNDNPNLINEPKHSSIIINKPPYFQSNYNEELFGIYLRSNDLVTLDLHERVDKIIRSKKEKQIIEALQKVDPSIQNISLGSKNMIYVDIGINRLVPIQLMGDGIVRMLSSIVTIASAENGFVLIDEIENGFHYSTLNILWKAIIDAAKRFNVQLFATTHSYECIRALATANSEIFNEDNKRIYRIEKTDDSKHTCIKYDTDQLNMSFESNWELR
jgi:AAA15 family ATPase/GTPase